MFWYYCAPLDGWGRDLPLRFVRSFASARQSRAYRRLPEEEFFSSLGLQWCVSVVRAHVRRPSHAARTRPPRPLPPAPARAAPCAGTVALAPHSGGSVCAQRSNPARTGYDPEHLQATLAPLAPRAAQVDQIELKTVCLPAKADLEAINKERGRVNKGTDGMAKWLAKVGSATDLNLASLATGLPKHLQYSTPTNGRPTSLNPKTEEALVQTVVYAMMNGEKFAGVKPANNAGGFLAAMKKMLVEVDADGIFKKLGQALQRVTPGRHHTNYIRPAIPQRLLRTPSPTLSYTCVAGLAGDARVCQLALRRTAQGAARGAQPPQARKAQGARGGSRLTR